MEFTSQHIRAFRYWIQGYQNFYEPIIGEFFRLSGYTVLAHPAIVGSADIQRIIGALFDGHKRLGKDVDAGVIQQHLAKRKRLQPDFLLERDGRRFLAELKSWGGFNASGQFDQAIAESEFLRKPNTPAFLLVDWMNGHPIAGKLLVVSSRSPDHALIEARLRRAYATEVDLLYLDEIFKIPQLAGFIDRQLRYLDAAVSDLRQALSRTREMTNQETA